MSFNQELLRHRAAEIRENAALLEKAALGGVDDFLADRDKQDATMFRLIVAIEACQAICAHLAARLATAAPSSMSDCFERLAAAGVYSEDLAQRLAQMARFRNLLVHRYWVVDLGMVHDFLATGLSDFSEYLEAVAKVVGEDL